MCGLSARLDQYRRSIMELGRLSRSMEKNGSTTIKEIWFNQSEDRVVVGDRPDEKGWEKIGWVEE